MLECLLAGKGDLADQKVEVLSYGFKRKFFVNFDNVVELVVNKLVFLCNERCLSFEMEMLQDQNLVSVTQISYIVFY